VWITAHDVFAIHRVPLPRSLAGSSPAG
jgi:hypothetical protein